MSNEWETTKKNSLYYKMTKERATFLALIRLLLLLNAGKGQRIEKKRSQNNAFWIKRPRRINSANNEASKPFFKHLILTLSHLVLVCNKECFIWARIVFCDGLQRPDLRFLTSNIIHEAHLLRKVAILKN